MKKIILTLISGLLITVSYSQNLHTVPYYDWSSKTAYMLSPSPQITGYGYLSDSLSKAHHDSTFYEYNGEYYPITCWADYYFWYVNKYWYNFEMPELYKYYYCSGDDFGMAQYICGNYFKGTMYPSWIVVSFPDRNISVNNMAYNKVKLMIKKSKKANRNAVEKTFNDSRINEKQVVEATTKLKNRDYNRMERNKKDIVENNSFSRANQQISDNRVIKYPELLNNNSLNVRSKQVTGNNQRKGLK